MPKPTEPYVHHYRLGFSDTDAARIAYTGRFAYFAMEAIEGWFRDRLGTDWFTLNVDEGIGTPFVHLALDFRSPLTPRDTVATTVILARLGRSSLTFQLTGCVGERVSFEGKFVCVFVDGAQGTTIDIPIRYATAAQDEAALAVAYS